MAPDKVARTRKRRRTAAGSLTLSSSPCPSRPGRPGSIGNSRNVRPRMSSHMRPGARTARKRTVPASRTPGHISRVGAEDDDLADHALPGTVHAPSAYPGHLDVRTSPSMPAIAFPSTHRSVTPPPPLKGQSTPDVVPDQRTSWPPAPGPEPDRRGSRSRCSGLVMGC